jgi:hypothetical protein
MLQDPASEINNPTPHQKTNKGGEKGQVIPRGSERLQGRILKF